MTSDKMFSEGLAIIEGLGCAKDEKAGVEMVQRAAFAGSTQAQIYLASLFMKGDKGVAKNENTALYWYAKYAESGDVSVMKYLGRVYAAKKDGSQKAIEWFTKAAQAGDEEAKTELEKLTK